VLLDDLLAIARFLVVCKRVDERGLAYLGVPDKYYAEFGKLLRRSIILLFLLRPVV
jgi:hypothetical protein